MSSSEERIVGGVSEINKDLELLSLMQLDEEIGRLDERKKQAQQRIIHLIATGKRPRKKCLHEGCSNVAQRGGNCNRHIPGFTQPLCKHEGCTKQKQRGGYCYNHGATYRLCRVDGCTKKIQQGGLCFSHGAKRKCPSGGDTVQSPEVTLL